MLSFAENFIKMKNIFSIEVTAEVIDRIGLLKADTQAQWGKMSVGQMLAHCCVTYEMVYDGNHEPAKGFKKFLLKLIVKNAVVNEKPYPKNSRTAPQFIITDAKDFEREKARLIHYMKKTQSLGAKYFDGKDSLSFGELSSQQWNNMFYKHLDHHLTQFGV